MAHGRPDFTYLADTDIIAQTIGSIAIDIAAQTIAELAIKTTGATKLAVDIAAQALSELDVNITAQDLAQLVIKIAAQSVGVYVERDWASTVNKDKSMSGGKSNAWNAGRENIISYLVDTGKVLYVDDIDISTWGIGTNKMAIWLVRNSTDIWEIYFQNDQPPYQRIFTTPKKFIAGETLQVQLDFVATSGSAGAIANLGCREYSV